MILDTHKLAEEMATLAAQGKDRDEDENERYAMLVALSDQIDFVGVQMLISEDDFERFAEDQAEATTGQDMVDWPFDHINWSSAANALKLDYKSVDFDGEMYWYKS